MIWSWILMVWGCFRVLVMLNLYLPIKRPGFLNMVSFFTGWLTGELMLWVLVLESVVILAFAQVGALHHPIGQAGMVLTVLAWFGFHLHMLSAKEVADATERALQKTFGKDYQDAIPTLLRERFGAEVPWRAHWLPFAMTDSDVERIKDVVYHEEGRLRLRLDIYRRRQPTEAPDTGLPILLQVHGGGWVVGSKDHQGRPIMNHMAARGWLGVAINYRLSPRATFPDHLIDVKRAIAWLRTHAAEYGGDPEMIVITGGSAGGHLASLTALTADQPQHQPGFEDADTSVAACVPFYGVFDMTPTGKLMSHVVSRHFLERVVFKARYKEQPSLFEAASPVAQIHADAPPFFVIHGDADSLAAVEDARRFAATLASTSQQPVAYAELPRTQHAFDVFHSTRCLLAVYAVARFLALLQSQRQRPSLPEPAPDAGPGQP